IGPWERRLRTLIEQYQLEDVIEMPGFKPSHEVKAMLDDADVFFAAVDYLYGWQIWKVFLVALIQQMAAIRWKLMYCCYE
ncbi:hypothetical protein LFZ30_09685, partial [Salmonella enterica subsp. enterica serovar Moscow str. SA20061414]